MTADILEGEITEKFDIVVFCGVFNIKTCNGETYMQELLKKGFDLCEKMVTFNFISSYVNYREEKMEYHDPVKVLKYCIENLSPKVDMEHHYYNCDVCCRVYR